MKKKAVVDEGERKFVKFEEKGRGGIKKRKPKVASIKNRIRSIERLLSKNLPATAVQAKQKELADLKLQAEEQRTHDVERTMAVRYRKVKFFERRKIERKLRRAETQLLSISKDESRDTRKQEEVELLEEIEQLKKDLEYVKFFPKTERYVSLFVGGDNPDVLRKREEIRSQIKINFALAEAAGRDLEETGSDEDDPMDETGYDEFFAGDASTSRENDRNVQVEVPFSVTQSSGVLVPADENRKKFGSGFTSKKHVKFGSDVNHKYGNSFKKSKTILKENKQHSQPTQTASTNIKETPVSSVLEGKERVKRKRKHSKKR